MTKYGLAEETASSLNLAVCFLGMWGSLPEQVCGEARVPLVTSSEQWHCVLRAYSDQNFYNIDFPNAILADVKNDRLEMQDFSS